MVRLYPPSHAGQHRAITQRDHNRVKRVGPAQQFEPDGASTLGNGGIPAVLDQLRAVLRCKGSGRQVGGVDILAKPNVSAEGTHALHLERIRGYGGEKTGGEAPPSARRKNSPRRSI